MDSDDELGDDIPDFEDASEEEKEEIRKALPESEMQFDSKALAFMREKNLTKEDITALLVKATKSDN